MMKRVFSMLLTVAMLLGMLVLPAAADTQEPPKVCPHCNVAWDECNWLELIVEEPDVTIPSGHYFLAEDLNTVARYKIGTSDGQSQELAVDVCLDLRGWELTQTTANTRAFYVYNHSTFAVMDSVGGGKIIGTGRSGSGGAAGGTIYACADAQVDLYGGALVNAQTDRYADGGVLFISTGATFNMYDGIIDGSAVTVSVDSNSSRYPRATAFCAGGTANIYDGLILGGNAYQGGTISVNSKGTLNVYGGKILGGRAESHGGCIYSQGSVNISGGLITGGLSYNRGGNIYSSGTNASLDISGGVIEYGMCSNYGGNVTASSGVFNLSGGLIRGNLYTGAATTLSGSPVVDNYGYEGMTLATGKLLSFGQLEEDARIVLWGTDAMTSAEDAQKVATYLERGNLIPASRYDLQLVDGVLMGSLDNTGYCPHCQQEITWEVYGNTVNTSGHYYVAAGGVSVASGDAAKTIAKGVDIVVNLAHGSVKLDAPYQVAGTLTVVSTAGSIGRISSTAATTSANGAVASVSGTMNIYDGIVGTKKPTDTVTTGNGGVVYLNGGKLNMMGGWIQGGTAENGGSVFLNGSAAEFTMDGGVVADGVATGGGGNLYLNKGKFTLNGGLLLNGSAVNAGNIYNYSGSTVYINDGIIANGVAEKQGGNLRHAATSSKTYMRNGLFYGGKAVTGGGNCYPNNGIFEMTGGQLINGEGGSGSGNLYASAGFYYIAGSGVGKDTVDANYCYIGDRNPEDNIPAPVLSGGRATQGGNINASGNLKLGACEILGGRASKGADLYLGDSVYLTVEPGFTQELVMTVSTARINELDTDRVLANSTCTQLNAKLLVENYDMAQLMRTAENALGLAGASVIDVATGKQTWYLNGQEAADACEKDQYVRLYAASSDLEIEDMLVLDLNGTEAKVTGRGTLFGFDSSNDTYETCGTVTAEGIQVQKAFLAPNGRQYVTLSNENSYSFHRLGLSVSHVLLRPSQEGIYYRGSWRCDSQLQEKIKTVGIALSTNDMPREDFANDPDTLSTACDYASFVNGQAVTSVMVKNILSEEGDNGQRINQQIYAAPYAVIDNGTQKGLTVVSEDLQPALGGVSYSMYEVLRTVNRIWPKLTDAQQEDVKTLRNENPQLGELGLYNVDAAVTGGPAVRPLKILTLGHSLALDACHMINLVAAEEGYSEEFIIGTLYYSGCPLYKHVNFLQNDLPEYSLHVSSTLTADQAPNKMLGYTMKMAIEYEDWDIIVMQGGVFEIAHDEKYKDGNIQIIKDYVNQYKTNPEAILAWHSPWAPPTTNSLRDKYPFSPNGYYTSYEAFNDDRTTMYKAITKCLEDNIVTDDSFVYLIPSCTVMENALSSYLEETDLHRDYVHASDLSRLMIAYLWYCTLTGIDHLEEIQVDAIPIAFLKSTSDKTVDRVITEAEKAIILEAVNNTLAEPLQMTQSQYTVAP